jgi:hypothetical protein
MHAAKAGFRFALQGTQRFDSSALKSLQIRLMFALLVLNFAVVHSCD